MRSPLKCGAGPLAWDRGDTRIAYVVKVVRKYRFYGLRCSGEQSAQNRYFLHINDGPLGGEDDAKSVFVRVNRVPPNRDAAGKPFRQNEEA